MRDMYGHVSRATLRRAALDFGLALSLFWLLAFAVGAHQGKAHAVPLYTIKPSQSAGFDKQGHLALFAFEPHAARQALPGRGQSLGLLSLAFAALVALNLAFWRHLRRAYASPRRGVWRRD